MPDKIVFNYEAMVILNPLMTEEETGALVARMAALLTEGGATLRETARWGRRRLAYPIDKKTEGYYVIFYFTHTAPGPVLGQFERLCRYEEQVLRHMVVRVPTKRRGQEVAQLVPAPGYMADFKLEPRAHAPRRRFDGPRVGEPVEAGGPGAAAGPAGVAVAAVASVAAVAAVAAVAEIPVVAPPETPSPSPPPAEAAPEAPNPTTAGENKE